MHLNLAKWLSNPELVGHGLLIGGGEECLPISNSLISIVTKMIGESHVQSFMADRYFDIATIAEIVNSASLFTSRNLIMVTFKTKPTVEQQKQLVDVYNLLDDGNFLILCCDKLDKKDMAANWVNYFSQHALMVNLTGDTGESIAWAKFSLTRHGLEMEPSALELLINLNQNNLTQLNQEINKLLLFYPSPAIIRLDDVKSLLLDNASYNIYALSEAYLSGNLELTRKFFAGLCHASEDVILIMWNLAEDLRKLIKIKGLFKNEVDFRSIASSLRIWGNAITTFKSANQRLGYSQLLNYFQSLALVDMAVKGVVDDDPIILLEAVLIDICLAR